MDRRAPRNKFAACDRTVAAAEIADEPTRSAHEQHTGSNVPDFEVAFPEAVVTARSNPCEVKARGAKAADTGNFRRYRTENTAPLRHIAMTHVRNARRDQAFVEVPAR